MAAKVRILYHPPEQRIGGREARQLAATQSTVVQIHSDTPELVGSIPTSGTIHATLAKFGGRVINEDQSRRAR